MTSGGGAGAAFTSRGGTCAFVFAFEEGCLERVIVTTAFFGEGSPEWRSGVTDVVDLAERVVVLFLLSSVVRGLDLPGGRGGGDEFDC